MGRKIVNELCDDLIKELADLLDRTEADKVQILQKAIERIEESNKTTLSLKQQLEEPTKTCSLLNEENLKLKNKISQISLASKNIIELCSHEKVDGAGAAADPRVEAPVGDSEEEADVDVIG
ncbi:hypothetical protein Btru_072641 [Bulinus truncatus]|nr:hypothetical protein Btru_072641 [Bulinus truncatus]